MRHIARCRGLRALAALAWLMLAIGSLAVAPLAMAGPGHVMAMAGPAAPAHGHHPAGTPHGCYGLHDDGSGTATAHGCGCQGLCSNLLPAPSAGLPAPAPVAVAYARPGRVQAPSPYTAPPLRPPLA
ncbi:MAG: hypothetical protein HOQ10_01170 [Frateuria sp.]|nr:hypothetical protein [Frateuria sp.]